MCTASLTKEKLIIKLILGGFPCTQFSIAQKNKRINTVDFTADEFVTWHDNTPEWWLHISEFEKQIGEKLEVENYKFADGLQLFFNCIVAVDRAIANTEEKVYYLFENVSSMQKQIKEVMEEILFRLYGGQMTEINSALVSAQNRKRIYFTNYGCDIEQPEDRGILLKDVLDSGINLTEKSYYLTTRCMGAIPEDTLSKKRHTMIAEPIKVGEVGNGGQGNRLYSVDGKAVSQTASGGGIGSNTGLYAEPVCVAQRGRYTGDNGEVEQNFEPREDGKTNTITTVSKDNLVAEPITLNDIDGKSCTIRATCYKDGIRNLVGNYVDKRTCVAEPIRIGSLPHVVPVDLEDLTPFVEGSLSKIVEKYGSIPQFFNSYNLSEIEDKSPTITACSNRQSNSGQVMCVLPTDKTCICNSCSEKEKCVGAIYEPVECVAFNKPIYEVKDCLITIKGKQYPIKLPDGFYLIRKLTISECRKLQTIPDWYITPCSASQNYKMLGNGWTVEVIKHILSHIPNIQNEVIEVVSMYDGMSCGMISLRELNCNVKSYVAYEIDKYAIQTTKTNFPEIAQEGDAFEVRDNHWVPFA